MSRLKKILMSFRKTQTPSRTIISFQFSSLPNREPEGIPQSDLSQKSSVTSSNESWWSRFRRELREEFEPLPTPRGYVNTTLLDFEKWEAASPEVVRESFKRAFVEVTGDWIDAWKWLRGKYTEETLEEKEVKKTSIRQEEENGNLGGEQPLAARIDTNDRIDFPTADDVRAVAAESLKRVKNLSADEELKGRVAGVVADGLKVARDSLDEFLIGFEEGKALEEKKRLVEEKAEEESRNIRTTKTNG